MNLLLLSKENIELARGEAEALLGKGKLSENILLMNSDKITDRLAYTRLICKFIFNCEESKVNEKIKKFNWNKIIKGSFALSFITDGVETSHSSSRKYGGMIYDMLKTPKVDLENPKTRIIAVQIGNKIYFGIEKWKNNEKFFDRRPDMRPGQQPVTLLPKLARACINMTGSNTSIYDPFCGVGGFLIEAGLMGLKAIGSDVSDKMLYLAKMNLNHYKIRKYRLFNENALNIKNKYDYIVTDPPYGKGSKIVGKDLYNKFAKNLRKILKKRAVIMFPDYINADKILKNNKLKVKAKYSIYVHKSLTRNIFVVEN